MIKKILKFIAFSILGLIAIVALGVGGYFGYENYKLNQELTFETVNECVEHDFRTQLCTGNVDGKLYLRRVDVDTGEIAISFIDDVISYTYLYYWPSTCDVGSKIQTDQTYSGGETVSLDCVDRTLFDGVPGKRYISYVFGSPAKRDVEFGYGGFSASSDFSFTNYSPLEQQITLLNAKTPDELAEEQRLEEEREVEEQRLEEEREVEEQRLEEERAEALAAAIKERDRRIEIADQNFQKSLETYRNCMVRAERVNSSRISDAKRGLAADAKFDSFPPQGLAIIFRNNTTTNIQNFSYTIGRKVISSACAITDFENSVSRGLAPMQTYIDYPSRKPTGTNPTFSCIIINEVTLADELSCSPPPRLPVTPYREVD
jgi:hypothetical protein